MPCIILNSNEAGAVAGPSAETPALAALQPVALPDGRFILGVEVMSDPAHAEHWAFLATLPTADDALIASLLAPAPSLGSRLWGAVVNFFAPDPVG